MSGNQRFVQSIFFLVILLLPLDLLAQSLVMQVSSKRISLEDNIQLKIRISGEIDEYQEPELKDWRVINSGMSTQTQIINGRIRKERIVNKVLEPRKVGTLVIGESLGFHRGKRVASAPAISIRVQPVAEEKPTTPKAASNLREYIGQEMFIVPSISNHTPFVGEPFVLGFHLYYRRGSRISTERVSIPTLDTVLTEDLLNGERPQSAHRLGPYRYEKVTLKEELVIPLKAEPIQVDALRMTLLEGGFFNEKRRKVASRPFIISVRKVPVGKAGTFNGNLGTFSIEAAFDKELATVGERRILTITIQGKGNLDTVRRPTLPDTTDFGFEPLDKGDRSRVSRGREGIEGEVSFLFMVTPKRAGALTMPPVTLRAFNPEKERYYEQKTAPLTLSVQNASEEEMAALEEGGMNLRPLVSQLGPGEEGQRPTLSKPVFWAVFSLPLLLLLAGLIRKLLHDHSPERQKNLERQKLMQALLALRKRTEDDEFERELQDILKRWRQLLEDGTAADIVVQNRWRDLDEKLNMSRFSPEQQSSSSRQLILDDAIELVTHKGGKTV